MVSCSGSSTLSTCAVMLVTSMAYCSSLSCVGAPGEQGLVVHPCSPCPMLSGRPRSRDARYSTGPLLASWVGWCRRRALDKCVLDARSRRGGCRGGHFAGSRRGRGPRGCLPRARVLVGLGPYAAPSPPGVGAPALAGCR